MLATVCFALAILHTFCAGIFNRLANRFPEGSIRENGFHLLGEVEVVFGLWAGVFMIGMAIAQGGPAIVDFMSGLSFAEPLFVFVIMVVCSTRPILAFAANCIHSVARLLPFPRAMAFYVVTLILGPLLGSLITEPAAMTVTAMLLVQNFFVAPVSLRLKYATLGLLFVNISVGGTLTHFAAPPVLMVASVWNWDSLFMLTHFGWKGALACTLSTCLVVGFFYRELRGLQLRTRDDGKVPVWIIALHLLFLVFIVATAHHPAIFLWIFLYFLGLVTVTKEFQSELKLRESLLVGFFLAGLVVLGFHQRWWLEPVLTRLDSLALYFGTIALTAVADNAALTYLGAQVPDLSLSSKYALVAGAVVGGGLTVIANAPNPAGYGILNGSFGKDGIRPLWLFFSALPPTIIASLCFWLL